MTTTMMKIDLKTMIGKKKKAFIDGTTLRGGTKVNERKVNYKIGKALRKLRFGDFEFSKGEIYLPDIMLDATGYLFKKSGKIIFLEWDSTKKRIPNVYLSHSLEKFEDEEILQSILCLEMIEDLTNFNIDEKSEIIFSEEKIMLETPESVTFADCVGQIEDAIEQEVFLVSNVSEDTFTINNEHVLTRDIVSAPVESVVSSSSEEVEEVKTVVTEINENSTENQLDLFEGQEPENDTIVVGTEKPDKIKKQKETIMPKEVVKQKEEKITESKITLEEVKKKRPLIFDDAWVVEKLKGKEFERKLLDIILKYREMQRNSMTPEQMMSVPEKAKFTGDMESLESGLVTILTGNNLIIKGETGTGKTTLTKTIDSILNRPLYLANGSADASIETFIGFKKLENGDISVTDAPLIKAMENGGTLYIDEGNAVLPSVLIIMHSAFDDERQMYNEMTGEVIYAHPEFRFITSINEEYAGTHELNDATMDRVVAIELTYMKPQDLHKLLSEFDGNYSDFQKEVLKMGDVSRVDLDILVEIAKALQLGVKSGLVSPKVASIRNIIALLKLTRLTSWVKACKRIIQKYTEDRSALAAILEGIEPLEVTATDLLEM